jgi:hypothetical protein
MLLSGSGAVRLDNSDCERRLKNGPAWPARNGDDNRRDLNCGVSLWLGCRWSNQQCGHRRASDGRARNGHFL